MSKNEWVMLALVAGWPVAVLGEAVPAPKMDVRWSLYSQDLKGKAGNGVAQTCRAAGAKTLAFTAVSEKTGEKKITTGVPCPAQSNQGVAAIDVPDAAGPFIISARVEGRKSSSSTYVCHVTPQSEINVWVFSAGCDSSKCTDACKAR